MNNENEMALLELEHRYGKEVRDRVEQMGFEVVKRGRWVKLDMHPSLADHKCTACGESAYVPTCMGDPMYLFCPNCGARMEGEGEENE